MYVGDQDVDLSRPALQFLVRHGVRNVDAIIGGARDAALTLGEADFREAIETAAVEGVKLEMTHINLPESITLAQDPQRDEDISQVCQCIENAGRAGLRGLNYNFLVGSAYARTPETPTTVGRGGSTYSQFDLANYDNSPPTLVNGEWSNGAGVVTREEVYERARYFLQRVIPTAEQFNVQLACHLNDPPAPVLRGVEQWNFPVFEGIKRFSELVDSPMHGFNFCCGTAAEGLENPALELCPIVEYFGRRKKLFNIHFRNVKGGLHDFREVWPDEGDVNMFQLAQTLHNVQYPYMLMPDHAPSHPDENRGQQYNSSDRTAVNYGKGSPFVFQFGYIIAIIQAVKMRTMMAEAPKQGGERASKQEEGYEWKGWDQVRDQPIIPRL